MPCLKWRYTDNGDAVTLDGRYYIDNLDNGYVLLTCRHSGLRKLCPNMRDAQKRAARSAYGVPHQLT